MLWPQLQHSISNCVLSCDQTPQKKVVTKQTKKYFVLQNIHFKEILNSQTVTKCRKTQNIKNEEKGMKDSKLTLT